jgi:DNA-binding NtrC family response regulator
MTVDIGNRRGADNMRKAILNKASRRSVILVGFDANPKAQLLAAELYARGLDVHEVSEADGASDLLRRAPHSVIVVYNPASTSNAHDLLAAVEAAHRRAPVVVLVDETDFGDYYSLMRLGALEYFAMHEQPELILRGIEWATESLAS